MMDILLVDDDETLRQSLQMLLESEGYSITEAQSGEKALEEARLHYFDLVLCDVRMPGIDGIETIAQLKDSIADAHFVVMTGYASEEAPIQALRLGVDDYLTKPFDIPVFLEKLRAIARRRKATARQANYSLWKLAESLGDHFPELASVCRQVEERTARWGDELELSAENRELLQLGSWFFPLGRGFSGEEKPEEEEPELPTEHLARLLRESVHPSQSDLTVDILRGAVAATYGESPKPALREEIAPLLEEFGASTPEPAQKEEAPTRDIHVKTLGGFEVRIKGELVDRKAWQSASARWLFVYLLSRGGQSVPEDRLAELFWPGSPPKKAHRALVSSVHRARKAIDNSDLLVRYDRSYGISRECDYYLDSEEMLEAYREGTRHFYQKNQEQALHHLQRVLELYRGPYLPDCPDQWCEKPRRTLRLKAVDAAEKVAQLTLETDPVRCEEKCRRAIQLEPTSEPAWCTLFQALAAQGKRGEVETAFRNCSEILKERLGLKPGASLRQTYQECLA